MSYIKNKLDSFFSNRFILEPMVSKESQKFTTMKEQEESRTLHSWGTKQEIMVSNASRIFNLPKKRFSRSPMKMNNRSGLAFNWASMSGIQENYIRVEHLWFKYLKMAQNSKHFWMLTWCHKWKISHHLHTYLLKTGVKLLVSYVRFI